MSGLVRISQDWIQRPYDPSATLMTSLYDIFYYGKIKLTTFDGDEELIFGYTFLFVTGSVYELLVTDSP